jgi:hypothetical protein
MDVGTQAGDPSGCRQLRRAPAPPSGTDSGTFRNGKDTPFIVLSDFRPAPHHLDDAKPAERFTPKPTQWDLAFRQAVISRLRFKPCCCVKASRVAAHK